MLVALAAVVGGHGLPLNVLGSMAIGWGVTAIVHLVFGSPLGLPSTDDVVLLLQELGVAALDVRPSEAQGWGVAQYSARLASATSGSASRLAVSVYGRDAADAKLLSKIGRFLLYRDSGPTLTLTRLQQVEREAYLTMWAGQVGAAVPQVVQAGRTGPSGDALLVCLLPDGERLSVVPPEKVTDRLLDALFKQLMVLRGARLAHGEISGETVLFDPATETASLVNFRSASAGASDERLAADVAGAMAAVALVVGADRAAGVGGPLSERRRPRPGAPASPQCRTRPCARSVAPRSQGLARSGPGEGCDREVDRGAEAGRASAHKRRQPRAGRRDDDRGLGVDRCSDRCHQLLRHHHRGRLDLGGRRLLVGQRGLRRNGG